jgi:predicted nucleic acid-binding protein
VAPLLLSNAKARSLPAMLSKLGIAGGAVYDALVALAAVEHGADLATRDGRARGTYEAVSARVIIVA